MKINLTFKELERVAPATGVYPIHAEVPADLLTPVAAYLKVTDPEDDSFLLESVEGGEHLARYSFLGKAPFLKFRARGKEVRLESGEGTEILRGKPLEALRELLAKYRRPAVIGLPPFTGGAVGFFSYDSSRYLEAIPDGCRDDLGMDDIRLGFYDTVLAFDHLRHRILIIVHVHNDGTANRLRRSFDKARARMEEIGSRLSGPLPEPVAGPWIGSEPLQPIRSADSFRDGVKKAKEFIRAGEIYQVVLSQRFEGTVSGDPFPVYRALRMVNPSPYMFHLRSGTSAVLGASPEMLSRVEGDILTTRPIAGTRKRGATEEEDRRLAEDLLSDEKERAEHLMLLDLGRNDVGRVSVPGTVEVTEFMKVEKYSHVMHLVSNVRGRIRPGTDPLTAFLSCFPAGTVTGAPKVRAMEIIDELEIHRRGPYAGAVAYLDFGGSIDSCITIRTVVVKDGRAYLQVGAGIVADSDPGREYQETVNKAGALQQALRQAGEIDG